MLILKVLTLEPRHGWGIMERIEQVSRGVFSLNQGSLYPALERLQRAGWVTSEWRVTEHGRRARYYAITRAGLGQLDAERLAWERSSKAVNLILREA